MILIAAVGKVSSNAARLLGQREALVRILVRDPQKATALARAEVEVAVGDLEVPATIDASDAGHSKHMLKINPEPPKQCEERDCEQ